MKGRRRAWSTAVAAVGAAALVGAATGAVPAAAAPAARASHRVCARSTSAGRMSCDAVLLDSAGVSARAIGPNATPAGYGPADLQSAYKLPTTAGSGKTVAIVDAYDLPTAAADLATYRSQYGLPACTTASGCFTKVNQTGGTGLPATNASWGQEIALDLDMVSASCPLCKILLVEATSPSTANLGTGVNTAVSRGAVAVSNSYGGPESSSDPTYDTQYYNHPGTAITVSSGDGGYGVEYPAASRYVTAVGGTSLTKNTSTRGWTESVWSGAGSGCSAYDAKPTWQTDTGCARRTVADVSAVADPNTGVAVYDSTAYSGQSGWLVFGGTSAASPLVAGVYALAGTPTAGTYPSSYPYSHTGNLFDVVSGSNGSCGGSYLCTGKAGYDGPSGLGTPNTAAAFAPGTGGGGGGGGGGGTPGQLLGNPGFETGSAAPWTQTAGVVSPSGTEPSHSGSYEAWLDGYGTTHTDTLAQSVTIPSTATAATLSYYLHIDSAETTTTVQYDKLSVQLVNSSGGVVATLASYSNLNKAAGYTQQSVNVAAYKGQALTLKFTGTEDSSQQTSFVVDDTALNYS